MSNEKKIRERLKMLEKAQDDYVTKELDKENKD